MHSFILLPQAVGQDNYRYFLIFLLAHVFLLFYGAAAMIAILYSEVTAPLVSKYHQPLTSV